MSFTNGVTDEYYTATPNTYEEYFLWIYEVGVGYQYLVNEDTSMDGWFKDTDGDGDYHNDPAGDSINDGDTVDDEELVSVLASYGWTMLP